LLIDTLAVSCPVRAGSCVRERLLVVRSGSSFPQGIIKQLGWKPGDELDLEAKNGKLSINKK
jgi:hypothetical protein